MDDLISRQAAIDTLEENKEMINALLDSLTLDYNTRRNLEQRRGQIDEDIETIKELPSAQPEQRWIPCSERLPEKYYNYLITTGKGDIDIGTFSPELNRWYICDADGFKRAEYVLAWMPLPVPWKQEGGG